MKGNTKMSRFDRILLSIFLWLGARWFYRCILGYDKNENVVYISFNKESFDLDTTEFVEYKNKEQVKDA